MRSTFALTLCLAAGCTPALGGAVPEVGSPPPTAGTRAAAAPLVTKRVQAKRAPATLVAEDATVCEVARDTFAATDAGALVRCSWLRAPAGR